MARFDDSLAYLELMATCDPGVAEGAPRGIPAPEFEVRVAEEFGHSRFQMWARMSPLQKAGLAMRLPGRQGNPGTIRITTLGIQARERVRGTPR